MRRPPTEPPDETAQGPLASKAKFTLDDLDRRILMALTANARASARELARALGVAAGTIGDRMGRMERSGIITGYTAVIAPGALGSPLAIVVALRIEPGCDLDDVLDKLIAMSEVDQVHVVTGQFDLLVFARVADAEHLNQFTTARLWKSTWFRYRETMLVIDGRSSAATLTQAPKTAEPASETRS